jgi:hypothetical protein
VAQWQALADINEQFGFSFLGLPPDEEGLDLKGALLATLRLTRTVAKPQYGIAYVRSRACYALWAAAEVIRWSRRYTNATQCHSARVAASRS